MTPDEIRADERRRERLEARAVSEEVNARRVPKADRLRYAAAILREEARAIAAEPVAAPDVAEMERAHAERDDLAAIIERAKGGA